MINRVHSMATRMVVLGALVSSTAGCKLQGTWETIAVDPEDVAFPLSHISFDDGRYTATRNSGIAQETQTGLYRYEFSTLKLEPSQGIPTEFVVRHRFDGLLELTWDGEQFSATGTLARSDDVLR